jgi:sugar O-acyltransferase (sialic acid O-acetyltransferase NeuD family)
MLQVDPTYTKEHMEFFIEKLTKILDDISKKLLIIIGCGGHSQVTTDIALDNKFFILGYYDDYLDNYEYRNIKKIGKINDLLEYTYQSQKCCDLVCGIGNIENRKVVLKKLENFKFKTLIHNSAIVSPTVQIGKGTVIMPRTVINSNVIIGNNCIINTNAVVEHDCKIGDNSHVCPSVTLCGGVIIGNNTMIGAGTVCRNSTHEKKIIIGDEKKKGIDNKTMSR